jgi:Fe-only nitrogenase accessory protein AnfO
MKIGIVMGAQGTVAVLENSMYIEVYQRGNNAWASVSKIEMHTPIWDTLADVRKTVQTVLDKLGDCKVIAARDMGGIAYQMFNRSGYHIFQMETFQTSDLDAIVSEIASAEQARAEKEAVSTKPVPVDSEGRYVFDLIQLQAKHPEISSKKALKTFLETENFYELKLICSHIPPWIEQIPSLNYSTKRMDSHTIEMIIERQLCKNC